MDLHFDLRLRFPDAPAPWQGGGLLVAVCDALRRAGLWLGYTHAGLDGDPLAPMNTPAQLAAWSAGWESGVSYRLSTIDRGSARATSVGLTPSAHRLRITLSVAAADVEPRCDTLLDAIVAFVFDVRCAEEALPSVSNRVRLGAGVAVTLQQDYPRPRPPCALRGWVTGSVLAFVDREDYAYAIDAPEADADAELARILASTPPPGSVRLDSGPVVAFRHVPDLCDEARVERARGMHDLWLSRLVPTERGEFWNEAGDELVLPLSPVSRPPLTFYDEADEHGYKAVFALADGTGCDELEEIAGWARAGALPDGTPIRGISVIVPVREVALAIAARVAALGFSRLLYTDNDRALWNPFPPGRWLKPDAG